MKTKMYALHVRVIDCIVWYIFVTEPLAGHAGQGAQGPGMKINGRIGPPHAHEAPG